MKLQTLGLQSFHSFYDVNIDLQGKNTVFYGINGAGKSSILKAINLLYANIINQIVNRKELRQKYSMTLDDIMFGRQEAGISAKISIDNKELSYFRQINRSTGRKSHDLKSLKEIAGIFQNGYVSDEKQENIPIFVNYGTNRLVLDIPMRIRKHHDFDIYATFDHAIENKIDFRTFFEWYREQQEDENQQKIDNKDLSYKDAGLESVRKAMLTMLGDCKDIHIERKPRLAMKIKKDGINLNISQLSDGEKCTMVLFGDIARRLTIANPNLKDPLKGKGIVLIDEIDLHMHPAWQRKVLSALWKTFPNIQFIVTTHSPIVLTETVNDCNVFELNKEENNTVITKVHSLAGYDINHILQSYMGTSARNEAVNKQFHDFYLLVDAKKFDEAKALLQKLKSIADDNYDAILEADMILKKEQYRDLHK